MKKLFEKAAAVWAASPSAAALGTQKEWPEVSMLNSFLALRAYRQSIGNHDMTVRMTPDAVRSLIDELESLNPREFFGHLLNSKPLVAGIAISM